MGDIANVPLAATGLTNPANAETNAASKRNRGTANEAENGLAAVRTSIAMTLTTKKPHLARLVSVFGLLGIDCDY